MQINMIYVPVKDLIQGYHEDDSTSKVTAWGGKLDVRPENISLYYHMLNLLNYSVFSLFYQRFCGIHKIA